MIMENDDEHDNLPDDRNYFLIILSVILVSNSVVSLTVKAACSTESRIQGHRISYRQESDFSATFDFNDTHLFTV